MTDLMIDFETLATNPNAVVLSLGACFFNIETGEIGNKFYMCFETDDQKKRGRRVDDATLAWWSRQSNAAKKVFTDKKHPVEMVLNEFVKFCLDESKMSLINPWGNGATFDISIIESLFEMYQIKCPWLYYNVMDLRTYRRFEAKNKKVPKLEGVNHHALDDAINQAQFVIDNYRK
jgi:hypothetical protein